MCDVALKLEVYSVAHGVVTLHVDGRNDDDNVLALGNAAKILAVLINNQRRRQRKYQRAGDTARAQTEIERYDQRQRPPELSVEKRQ